MSEQNWGEVGPVIDPLPHFDTYFELWDHCFGGFRNLLRPEVRNTFVAIGQSYTEEIVRIAKEQKATDDSAANYWPDLVDHE